MPSLLNDNKYSLCREKVDVFVAFRHNDFASHVFRVGEEGRALNNKYSVLFNDNDYNNNNSNNNLKR